MARSFAIEARPKVVILSAHWLNYAMDAGYAHFRDQLRKTISFLEALGIKVVLLGPSIQYTEALPRLVARSALPGYPKLALDAYLQPAIFTLDRAMKSDFDRANTAYISIVDSLCPDRVCPTLVRATVPLLWDEHHLTAEGSEFVVLKILPQLEAALPKR
jgi:hypothetical protein